MPGRFYLTTPMAEIAQWMGASPTDLPNEPPRFNVAPGQNILVLCDGKLTHMRWGIIPVGRVNARGRPVMETIVNARSETVFTKSAFAGVKRCLVPMNGWYEWTGEKRKKTAWRIFPKAGGLMAFAAIYDIWNGPGGIEVPQVATITCEPSADVRDIHHRMGVILEPSQFDQWLNGDEDRLPEIMMPYPDGMLTAEKVSDVDWDKA